MLIQDSKFFFPPCYKTSVHLSDKLPLPVWKTIKSCNILARPPTHRGKRSGFRNHQKSHRAISHSTSPSKKFTPPQEPCKPIDTSGIPPPTFTPHNETIRPINRKCKLLLTTWNARSICNKATEICAYTIDNDIDILALTETWLKPNANEQFVINECTPNGYLMSHTPRVTSSGGGIAIIYKSSLKLSAWKPQKNIKSFEATEATFLYQGISLKVIIVYRPPPNPKNKLTISLFLVEFATMLEKYASIDGHLFIVGDFNLHIDDKLNANTKKFTDIIDSCNLKQYVHEPTHIRGHTLDLVITNSNAIDSISTDCNSLSDHRPVHARLVLQKPPLTRRQVTYRGISSIMTDDFANDITSANDFHRPSLNVEDAASSYNTVLCNLLDKHAPIKKWTITVRPNTKWYTAEIHQAKKQRRAAERKWRQTRLEIHLQIYSDKSKHVNKLIRKAKHCYYTDLIKDNAHDQKLLYRTLSALFGKPRSLPNYSSARELAQRFSDYFINKIKHIRYNLDAKDSSRPTSPIAIIGTHRSLSSGLQSFQPASHTDIQKIIKRSPTKSCSLDPIPTSLLKQCLDALLPHITQTINLSLQLGEVPALFKSAIVTPLLKKPSLDRNILKNYRPVSNLPFLSKVLEKTVSLQLKSYLSDHSLLEPLQSAYRQYHSTETALIKVHDDICMALDAGKCVLLVLLDLSAAFDTIDHSILLTRLSELGISGTPLQWFKSYLKNRQQSVIINDLLSSAQILQSGVPQGSVLGPLLFCIYISPLGQLIRRHKLQFHQYADDNQLYLSFSQTDSLESIDTMETAVNDIKSWMTQNKLQLNDDKTEVLLIRSQFSRSKPRPIDNIFIGSSNIALAESARNIGVIFDQHFTFKNHISTTCRSIHFNLRNIRHIRKFITKETCQQLVHALLSAKLDYGNALLYGLPFDYIKPLQQVQNTAARIVARVNKYDHITPTLKELHWLPITHRINYKIMCTTYKSLNGLAPGYLSDILHFKQSTRTLRSSNKCLLSVPKHRLSSCGGRAFSRGAPSLWNTLPLELRQKPTFDSFRRNLKTHIFAQAYNC